MNQTARKSDSEIQREVAQECAWDTRVSPTQIGVQVKNGVVTLAGSVDSWATFRAAGEAAHRVAGVLDVANDLSVKLPGTSEKTDAEIAETVRMALEWDVILGAVRGTRGVRDVADHLSIQPFA